MTRELQSPWTPETLIQFAKSLLSTAAEKVELDFLEVNYSKV
jgi:hypothetical protein